MANIPISALPNVQPSGYTPNDLLVIVNSGVTKNTELSAITSYVFSSFTGNTLATCITDLYVTNLYGCSPINVNDSLIMTTGTSISSSNGTAKIELDSGGNPDTLFISTSLNDTYLQLDSNIEFISNNGYLYSYAFNSITEESEGQIENLVYGNGGSQNIKWKMDAGTGGNPGSFYFSNSGGYNTNGEFIKFGFDSFNNGGYLNIGSKSGSDSVLTIESNKSGLYFDDSAPLSPYNPPRPFALFNSKNTIDIFTDRVSTLTEGDFSLRVVNQDNFKKSGLYAGYLNSVELASNDKAVFFSRDNSLSGYYGLNAVSFGGAGGTVLIGTGIGSYIESGITNTVVIGGDNIFADTSDTVYVPNLNIGTIGSNTSVINLGLDSNGFVVTGSTFTGGTVSGETIFTGGLSATTFSATTIGESGNCVNDLYVLNIHSCSPLNINPLNEGNVYVGSANTLTVDLLNERVGVGTSSPSAKVHVNNTGSTDSFLVEDETNPDSTPFLIDYLGNVGIGTFAPIAKLDIVGTGSSSSSIAIKISNNTGTQNIKFLENGVALIGGNTTWDGFSAAQFARNGGGYVLQESPQGYKLYDSSGSGGLWGIQSSSSNQLSIERFNIGAPMMTFDSNLFRIGAFTTTPTAQLHVRNTSYTDAFRVENTFGTDLVVSYLGDVGIGTSTPTEKLEVSGRTKTTNFTMTSGATNGYVLTSDVSGNATWSAPSGLSTKAGTISGATFTGTPLTYDVVFTTPYPSTSYSISISGGDARIFTYELKTTTGFRINTNSSTPLTGDVDWMTIAHGES